MARLYDYETEEVRTVPDNEVAQLVLSGSHSFLQGDKVHIKDDTGDVFEIPATDGHLALRDGYQYAGAKDVELAKLRSFASKRPGTSLALGFLRSLSFGYSDKLLTDVGIPADAIKAYRDANPGFNLTGEALAVLPRFTPVGGAMAIGSSLVKSRLKGKITGGIASGAVEGAIATTPMAVSESILNEKPNLSAEQIMAGSGFGSAIGGISGLLSRSLSFVGGKGKSLADYLYFRSTGARTPEYNKLTRYGMNRERVGQIGRRMRELQQQGAIKSLSDHENILNTLQDSLIPQTGQKLNDVLKEVRKVQGDNFLVNTSDLADRMKLEIRAQFKDASGQLIPENQLPKAVKNLINKADKEIDEIRKLPDQDFFGLETQKRLYSKLKNWTKPMPGTSVSDGMDRIYGSMSKVLREESENVLERVEQSLINNPDKALFETFKQLKNDYGDLRDLEMLMSASVRRDAVNNTFGLTSMNLGAGLGAGGIAAGESILGSIGGGTAGLMTGMLLRKMARDKGELIAARTLDNVLDMTGALGNISRTQSIMTKAVKGLMKGTLKGVPVVEGRTYPDRESMKSQMKNFEKMRKDLNEVMTNQDSLFASIEQSMPTIKGNTAVQGAVMQSLARGANFLHSKLPKDPTANLQLVLPEKPYTPNPAEISKFFRYEEIVNEPLKTFGHLINGTFTPEHREALVSVYPELYKEMQEEILKGLAEGKPNMSLPQKIQLSIFMGKPVDPTMTYLKDFQMSYMNQEGGEFRPKDRKIKGLKEQAQTDIERVV